MNLIYSQAVCHTLRMNRPARRGKSPKIKSSLSQASSKAWLSTLPVVIIIFVSLSVYLFLRRGYYNTYIVNKVLGSTAAILAALSLSAGVLTRWNPRVFSFLARIRRELGLSAWFFALLHMATSLLFLNSRFPLSWYQEELAPFFAGIFAVAIWSILALLSRHDNKSSLSSSLWVFIQSTGARLAFLFVLVHLVVMKYQGWIKWFSGLTKQTSELLHPEYPPASLFVLLILLSVFVLRIVSWLRSRR